MLFGNAFDAVTRIVGIVVRRGNEITNLIRAEGRCSKPLRHQVHDLADIELVSTRDVPSIKFDFGMLRMLR